MKELVRTNAAFQDYSFIPLSSLIYMPDTQKNAYGVLKI